MSGGSGRPVVLVVEDDASVRMTLSYVLEDEGFAVLEAVDGEEAMRLATTEHPSVILLDSVMPKMGGPEVLAALKEDEATSDIPVFILSGMTPKEDTEWAGAHFIGKPFSPDDLVERIRSVLADSGE
ncbi:MAG: response regulator transcription factor [Actinomycetota bacterium]